MPNRHEILSGNQASEEVFRELFGIPNRTDPPYFGRFTGCLMDRRYQRSTIRMGEKGLRSCRKIGKKIFVDRRTDGRFAICRDKVLPGQHGQDLPFTEHPRLTDPGICFPDPALDGGTPCTPRLLRTASIRAARPLGHAPTVLGRAQHRSVNTGKVQLLSRHRRAVAPQYQFGSRLSCSLSMACMPSSGSPSQR